MGESKRKKMSTQVDPTQLASQSHTDMMKQVHKTIAESTNTQNTIKQQSQQTYSFKGVHLGIGLPTYGGLMNTTCAMSLLKFAMLANQVGLMWSLETMINESLVQRARNSLMAKLATNKDITHFFFLDSDIEFDAEQLIKMVIQSVVDPEKAVIGGVYPKKCLPIAYNLNFEKETRIHGPLYTVDTLPTGFLMFQRRVWEDLVKAHPEWKYKDDIGLGKQYEPMLYSVFDCYIDEAGHYLSEDWAFCRRAKKLGYLMWCDSRVKLNHIGNYTFNGNTDLLKIEVEEPQPAQPAEVSKPVVTETPTLKPFTINATNDPTKVILS